MTDFCNQESNPLLSIDAALERIKAAIHSVAESEKVALKNALGRVLSESIYSPINSPHDRNAASASARFGFR